MERYSSGVGIKTQITHRLYLIGKLSNLKKLKITGTGFQKREGTLYRLSIKESTYLRVVTGKMILGACSFSSQFKVIG